MHAPHDPGTHLRRLMDHACVAAPGAFNGLCARAIAQAGFHACYVSGAATSVSAGVPDVGILTLEHFARTVREVCQSAHRPAGTEAGAHPHYLPVLADADTGFGEAEMVRRTVIEYARAGAAGLHIEDQVFPKRCGHLDGKMLVPVDHMVEKIQWAVKAAKASGSGASGTSTSAQSPVPSASGFIICARTDAASVEGLDAAIARARTYVQAGADMIFPEGLTSEADLDRFAKAMGAQPPQAEGGRTKGSPYLLANMTEFGKTPIIPLDRFQQMGYAIVIFPVTLLRAAMGEVARALEILKKDGSAARLLEDMQTRQQLYDLIGYKPGVPWELPPS